MQVFTDKSWQIRMLASESFELQSCETTWVRKPVIELMGNRMVVDVEAVRISELHVVREGAHLSLRYLW